MRESRERHESREREGRGRVRRRRREHGSLRGSRVRPLPHLTAAGAVLLLAVAGPAFAAGPAHAGTPSPKARPTIGTAGTSFLTATEVRPGWPVRLSASTGDYLYWSFAAAAGQTDRVGVSVTLPPAANRHGDQTWIVEVFDGLRRRQSCTAGPQTVTAQAGAAKVVLGCTLRRIRSWAEPWSSDPLPGTYYVRLSAAGLPEPDLGLPIQVRLRVTAKNGDAEPPGGRMRAPLSPAVNAGATMAPDAMPSASPSPADSAPRPVQRARSWLSWPSSRWWWTIGGGVLATIAGVAGYTLTRHPRRWFS